MRADQPYPDYNEAEAADEERDQAGAFFRRDRAVDAVPDEPDVMAPSEKYQLTFAGKRQRVADIFKVLRKYDLMRGMTPQRLRRMLEELGPTFVKVGQILSTRSEVLPQSYCDELAKLRTDVEPVPFSVVRECLEAEYRRPVERIFSSIDEKPLGSASIAQVHRATLVNGTDVAVKVQRPGVQQTMARDIDIMRSIARIASRFVGSEQVMNLQGVVEELWLSFQEETNFLIEAKNLSEFYEMTRREARVSCPQPFLALCTEHVVVMEYIEGISISKPGELAAAGYDLEEIGRIIVDNYSTQVLDNGFFHADPHAGNIIVKNGVVYFIDLGIVGRVSSADRSILRDIIYAVAEGDTPKLKEGLTRFNVARDTSGVDHAAFLADLDVIVEQFGSVDLADLNIGSFLLSIINLARKHKVELPSVITMVARGMVTLEGLLTAYLPQVNMIQIISAHIKREKSSFQRFEEAVAATGAHGRRAFKGSLEAAEHLGLAARMLTRGQLKMNTEFVGSEKIMQQIGFIFDRLSMAVIIAGLFIGSSVVYYAGIQPVIFGIPVLGFVGYVGALVMVVMVGRDIWRNGHHKRR